MLDIDQERKEARDIDQERKEGRWMDGCDGHLRTSVEILNSSVDNL
jgi:hypothetical protein